MDFDLEVQNLRLDKLAVDVSRVLMAHDLPHLLIKGPTTASWLYDPPRAYRDADILIPRQSLDKAVEVLISSGTVSRTVGMPGEQASHAQLLVSRHGLEVDLHISLPLLNAVSTNLGNATWNALYAHREDFPLQGHLVPAFDLAGRCLVLCLHALANPTEPQALEDLSRAYATASEETWSQATELARRVAAESLFEAAIRLSQKLPAEHLLSPEVRLLRAGASSAYQLERISRMHGRAAIRHLWREAFPSVEFMRNESLQGLAGRSLLTAYARRLYRLTRSLPAQVGIWLSARHDHR